jgi:predicted dehydrogenase
MAFARLTFENGCVALVRASRVSLRKVRKLRVFCPDLYVSLDYLSRQGTTIKVREGAQQELRELLRAGQLEPAAFFRFLEITNLTVEEEQPLRAELTAFLDAFREGRPPPVGGEDGREALACALRIEEDIRRNLDRIREKRKILTPGQSP